VFDLPYQGTRFLKECCPDYRQLDTVRQAPEERSGEFPLERFDLLT
jgi:hypothetical protein